MLAATRWGRAREGKTLVKSETRASFSPQVVDGLADAVVLIDDHGAVLYANPALQRLMGWNVRSLFGTAFTNLVPERQRDEFEAGLDDLVHADSVPRSRAPIRATMLCADGSELPVEMAVSIVDHSEGPRLVVAVIWDVSDRIDIERY